MSRRFFSSLQSLDFLNANESQVGEGTAMSCPFSFPVCQWGSKPLNVLWAFFLKFCLTRILLLTWLAVLSIAVLSFFFSSNIAFCCLRVWFSNLWCSLIYCVDKASWFCIYFSLVTWGIQHKHILFLITEGKALGFLISHRASLVQRHRCHGRELHTPQCYYSSCNTKSPLKSSMQGSTVWLEPFESSILVPQVRHQEISIAINHITK